MALSFPKTEEFLRAHVASGGAGDVMLSVGIGTETYRFLHSARGDVLTDRTLCDMMSVTKILCTTSLCLLAIAEGRLRLTDTLGELFSGAPDHLAPITVQQLMTHTSGLRHSFLPKDGAPYTHDGALAVQWQKKLFSAPGESCVYACNNMILLALAMEELYGEPLDTLFDTRVAKPLGLAHTHYRCAPDADRILCTRQEGDNLCDDPSARRLGGVAGHAGIFSCLADMETFARALLGGLSALLPREVFDLARKNHTPHLEAARGLGYLYVDHRYPQTGRLFSEGSIGHCGHSGQSVFVDFEKQMHVVALSNTTLYSACRGGTYGDTVAFRTALHNKIADDLGF